MKPKVALTEVPTTLRRQESSPYLEHPHGLRGHTEVAPASGTSLERKQTQATSGTKTALYLCSLTGRSRSPGSLPHPPHPPTILDPVTKPLRRMVILVILDKSFSLRCFLLQLFNVHLLESRHIGRNSSCFQGTCCSPEEERNTRTNILTQHVVPVIELRICNWKNMRKGASQFNRDPGRLPT